MDYEDVALFSDEKKYVALIKSDADSERNYGGCATRWVHLGPRVFTEQPVFRLFLFPFSVSLPPSRPLSYFSVRVSRLRENRDTLLSGLFQAEGGASAVINAPPFKRGTRNFFELEKGGKKKKRKKKKKSREIASRRYLLSRNLNTETLRFRFATVSRNANFSPREDSVKNRRRDGG